ncbi:centromere protein H [Conger conger]|uniref:centromere protein H n=1 Tax=Conger conger TaxID=82655 RepID=UPI002A5A7631|nr:centromere protein H [Conger conger]XP_061117710.1 centromere protein H [Conger conger]
MDVYAELQDVALALEKVALMGCHAPEPQNGKKNNAHTDILRIKEQMSNQCFEMMAKIRAGKSKIHGENSDAEKDESEYEKEIEEAKISHCNKTLALHRMQVWEAISEKLKQSDVEADAMRASTNHTQDLCSKIMKLQQQSRELQEQTTGLQKQKLELKKLTHERMQEIEELKRLREHPEEGKYSKVLEKAQSVLEKYQKMTAVTQNVLRGVILACRIHWRDDPKLAHIVLGLEGMPDSD